MRNDAASPVLSAVQASQPIYPSCTTRHQSEFHALGCSHLAVKIAQYEKNLSQYLSKQSILENGDPSVVIGFESQHEK